MKVAIIFVCLGNPGKRCQETRHNLGRLFGKYLVDELSGSLVEKNKFGEVFELKKNWSKNQGLGEKTQVIFLNCYMNESGWHLVELLKKLGFLKKNKLTDHQSPIIRHLFVVHDDLDLPFGRFKIQFGRGAAGHHGVESVIKALGTKQFWRLRLGIGRPPVNIEPEKYVLMPFSQEEKKELVKIFSQALKRLEKEMGD